MSRTGGGKRPSVSKPKSQGSAGTVHTQTPIRGGSNADRPPRASHNINTSITKPGKSTHGSGTTSRKPKAY